MKKPTFLIMLLLITACNSRPVPKVQPTVAPVSTNQIIAKFENTAYRQKKLKQGASGYTDTTFKRDLFVVRDTVTEIRSDNKGKPYIILGRQKNGRDLKCYFIDDKVIDSLKVSQVITVSSNRHAARFTSLKLDTIISVLVVEMAKCSLVKK